MNSRYEIGASRANHDDLVVLIDIEKAENLAKKDTFGLSDPYVKVSLYNGVSLQAEYKTITIKKTLNPTWDIKISARIKKPNVHESYLLFEVFDANKVTRDDFLGQVEINARSVPYLNRADSRRYLLRPRTSKSRVRGNLVLKVCSSQAEPTNPLEVDLNDTPEEPAWDMVAESSHPEPLPAGWASGVDDEGRTFYIDHTNQRTQWERPGIVDLPRGWEERIDANGRTFYIDHRNKVTQWERPTEAVSQTVDDVERLRRQATEMFLTTRHQVSQEDVDSRNQRTARASISTSSSQGSIGTAAAHEEPLPPGWSSSRTETGRVFYIDHRNKTTTWNDPRNTNKTNELPTTLPSATMKVGDSNDLGPLPDGWEQRTHSDGRVFFINHVTKSTQWEDPRLKKFSGPAVKYNRDYQQKYNYFRGTLQKPANLPNKVDIRVKRADILETSFQAVMSKADPDALKTKLWVEFDGEKGLDYGGVSREWFYLLSKEIFNPYYGLFENSAADNYTLQINPLSGTLQTDHLKYFRFIGRIAGLAAFHGRLLDGFFIRPFYKMMLEKEITLQDMQSVDLEYFNSLNWIIHNSVEGLDMTFSVDEEVLGQTVERPLKPNGANIPVTDRNKQEYVNLVIKHRFCGRIADQMKAFNTGFSEIVPLHLLKIFDENELEMLLCGIQDIDVKDWQKNTNYKGDYGPNHPTIVNFWRAVYLMPNESRARLLQFVTGTSRVPMNGFKEMYGSNGKQLFTIENWGSVDKYPRAHTCFNRLDLPPYTSYEMLTEKLTQAVESCEGFEGVD